MGRGDPKGGRPPVDGRVRAAVLGLAVEHPDWGSRRIAREAGASRRSTQRWLAAEGLRGTGAARMRVVDYAAEWSGVGVMGAGPAEPGWRAAWRAREMTPEDHRRFDEYRGAVYESPGVWWTFP